MPVDLNPVEFMQLMGQAQRRVVLQGNDINQQGRPHEEIFLIVEGTADVGLGAITWPCEAWGVARSQR